MSRKIVYLMRGLPSCGKSRTAVKLIGKEGIICETDAFFFTQVGKDHTQYDYNEDLLEAARNWNFERFQAAVDTGISPVVVDRGNGLNRETQKYACYAVAQGYTVEIKEPESLWWQEIRVLLKYKQFTWPVLEAWAKHLAKISQSTHRVSQSAILNLMHSWKHDITVQDILNYNEQKQNTTKIKGKVKC